MMDSPTLVVRRHWAQIRSWFTSAATEGLDTVSLRQAEPSHLDIDARTQAALCSLRRAGYRVRLQQLDGIVLARITAASGRSLKVYACDAHQAVHALAARVRVDLAG